MVLAGARRVGIHVWPRQLEEINDVLLIRAQAPASVHGEYCHLCGGNEEIQGVAGEGSRESIVITETGLGAECIPHPWIELKGSSKSQGA